MWAELSLSALSLFSQMWMSVLCHPMDSATSSVSTLMDHTTVTAGKDIVCMEPLSAMVMKLHHHS